MDQVWRILDAFLGAAIIAASGVAASQAHAFLIQYIDLLGGRLNEATAHLNNVQNGLRYRLMSETVRKEAETAAQNRVADLQEAYHAMADANVLVKPIAFLRRADSAMLANAWQDFIPALPRAADGIFYAVVAMIVGFLLYELVKLPVVMLVSEPRRRKFRRRG